MLKIYYNNIKSLCIKKRIQKLFDYALKNEISNKDYLSGQDFEVSIRYASEDEIKKINNEYRQIDKATDVLSFPIIDFNNDEDVKEELSYKNPSLMLGDIVICKKVAKKQAKLFCHSQKREISFLALHGFLHLLGYDHIKREDEIVMQELAEKILENFNIRR